MRTNVDNPTLAVRRRPRRTGVLLTLVAALSLLAALDGRSGQFRTAAAQTACPCSIFANVPTPEAASSNDGSPIEVGVKFRSSMDGYITGIRLYKGNTEAGSYKGNLWSGTGELLASAVLDDQKASGWLEMFFRTAVSIKANTTYVASSYSATGDYAATSGFFTGSSADQSPLRALADGEDGPNGVFKYGESGLPTEGFRGAHYWVDAVFDTTPPPVRAIACPCNVFGEATKPDTAPGNDGQPVEVGMKFRSSRDGYITGMRLYKGSTEPGTYTGNLWSSTGTNLAGAVVEDETRTGWIEMTFGAPVVITANTTYVVSYHSSKGDYTATGDFFARSGRENPPLRALVDGEDGPNGLFTYGESSFPTESFKAANYWVDAVFNTAAADLIAPAVLRRSPAVSAKDVVAGTKVTATFTEAVTPAAIAMTLRRSATEAVESTVTYDARTRTATLAPKSALAEGVTYTVSVTGAVDLAGNAMPAAATWSFTTSAAAPAPEASSASGAQTAPSQAQRADLAVETLTITSSRYPSGSPTGGYSVGDTLRVCVAFNRPSYARVTYMAGGGGTISVLFDGFANGRQCSPLQLEVMITGSKSILVEGREGGKVTATRQLSFSLNDDPE